MNRRRQQWARRRSHLFHGDEHASSGRTSSDGGNHRRRSGRMAASSRERRTVTQAAGGIIHQRLGDESAPLCGRSGRSEEHTSELQSLMRISYAVFCLKKKTTKHKQQLPLTTTLTDEMIKRYNHTDTDLK